MDTHLLTSTILRSICLGAAAVGLQSAHGQGALTPPGAPAPTMKSLEQIEPRVPIASLPYAITNGGSYYVTGNLNGIAYTNGLIIAAANVTVDLGGFHLRGNSRSGTGVYIAGNFTNITVRDGTISGWGSHGVDGISGGAIQNVALERLTVTGNRWHGIYVGQNSRIRDCIAVNNATNGLYVAGGRISGCQATDNGADGIYLQDGQARDCRVRSNGGSGIVAYHSQVRDCYVQSGGQRGVYIYSSEVRDCKVENCALSGIYVTGSGSQVVGNALWGNNWSGSTNDAGIYVMATSSRIDGNHVVANGSGPAGIYVYNAYGLYSGNCVARNSVSGFGAKNYVVSAGNDLGPVGTAATGSSPWANLSY